MKHVNESIVSAGFGGQGIMVLGKVFANSGIEAGFNVTFLPSYGAEVRGGTAYSLVRVSSTYIGSPVEERPLAGIIMNAPSLDKFQERIAPGGLLIINTSLVSEPVLRKDLHVVEAPITDEAIALGNVKVANMIAAGIYASRKPIFSKQVLLRVIEKMAGTKKNIIPANMKAVERGMDLGGK